MSTHAFFTSTPFTVHVVAPVHIGTGDILAPTNYVIKDQYLYEFSYKALAEYLPETARKTLDQLLMAADANSISRLQQLMHDNLSDMVFAASRVAQVPAPLEKTYKQKLGKPAQIENGRRKIFNQLEIQQCYRHPTSGDPILPGSSLKGALRTALLDTLAARMPKPSKQKGVLLERELLHCKSPTDDPFKRLKVSDAHPAAPHGTATTVYFARARKRKPEPDAQTAGATLGWHEVVQECQMDAFAGELRLFSRTGRQDLSLPAEDLTALVAAVNAFNAPLFEQILDDLERNNQVMPEWARTVRQLYASEWRPAMDAGRLMLVSLGKHGAAESKTFNTHRIIKVRVSREKSVYQSHGTTWHLALDEDKAALGLPFGWVLIELCTPGESRLSATRQRFAELGPDLKALADKRKHMAEQLEAARQAREQRLAEAHRRAEEAEARRRQEEAEAREREARLAALSPAMQQAEALREAMARGQDKGRGAGCPMLMDLKSLAESELTAEEAGEVLKLADAIFAHTGVNPKKAKSAKQLRNLLATKAGKGA